MTIQITRSGEVLQLDEHLGRLRRLVADVEGLKSGRHFEVARLEGSAHIRDWVLNTRPAPCLRGYIEGHPDIRSGRMGVTSDLWIWAPDHGYARTLSRWYTLGDRGHGFAGSGSRWRLPLCRVPCLVGAFESQPTVADGRLGWTADLVVHAPELGYARMLTRLYRLGAPAGEARP